jgi:hypothetical protein
MQTIYYDLCLVRNIIKRESFLCKKTEHSCIKNFEITKKETG